MAGDGLWSPCSNVDEPAFPLPVAAERLADALKRFDSPPLDLAAPQSGGWLLLRAQTSAVAFGPRSFLLMDWLAAQRQTSNCSAWPLAPRALFAARDGSEMTAGVGHAHIHHVPLSSNDQRGSQLLPELGAGTNDSIRYLGGLRFDSADPEATDESGAEWRTFGQSYWVLPRVELVASQASGSGNDCGVGSDTSHDGQSFSADDSGLFGGSGCLVRATLAVNFRWHPTGGPDSWIADKNRALAALSCLRAPGFGNVPMPSSVARRSEVASEDEFAEQINKALKAFEVGEMQKVVFARRVDLDLVDEVDPVDCLAQVVGQGQNQSYLFLLEPEVGTAFMSVTPERLCKIQGRDVWTEAVAGTWPLAEFERIGESGLLASSEKHCSEHGLVVDYICDLLGPLSEKLAVCDRHILKLKHVVHIKQTYHAITKGTEGIAALPPTGEGPRSPPTNNPHWLASWFCQRVSPTPAVGGLPLQEARRFIRASEKFDRGFYAAPCGAVGARGSELIVAIRSALLHGGRRMHVYAGAGIVPGSTAAGEFAEMSLKMKQFIDAFAATTPTSPSCRLWTPMPAHNDNCNLRMSTPNLIENRNLGMSVSTLNMIPFWASLFAGANVRTGTICFVICPGPSPAALAIAISRQPSERYVIPWNQQDATSFALGFAKPLGEPVGIVVTSSSAAANLISACQEAAVEPSRKLLVTADRRHELKDVGLVWVDLRCAMSLSPHASAYFAHAFFGGSDLVLAQAGSKAPKNRMLACFGRSTPYSNRGRRGEITKDTCPRSPGRAAPHGKFARSEDVDKECWAGEPQVQSP